MYKKTGAEFIIEFLERQGITVIAGIPGGSNLPLYDALSRSKKIKHILARHEQGAGFIAQGLARTTELPGVCFATSGPGATNILTAVADAFLDSIPLICITGQVARPFIGTDAFQEVDTYGMSMAITKHNYLIKNTADLLTVLPEAFRLAMSGRPGPVLIDVPKDVQTDTIQFAQWPDKTDATKPKSPHIRQLKKAAELIAAAQRPILCLGGGANNPQAAGAARSFLKKLPLPTVTTLLGLGVIPQHHPASLGMLGMHGAVHANRAIAACDLFIAVGMRFDDRATGRLETFCPQAKIIHIDIDPGEINKLKQATVSIVADSGDALRALTELCPPINYAVWQKTIRAWQQPQSVAQDLHDPRRIIRSSAEIVGREALVCTDVGQHQMWVAQEYPFMHPRQLLTSGGLGTMGFGLPAAIGAALGNPQKTILCFSGDGSLMMNIQELITLAELDLNVKVIVCDNQSLGLVRQQQELFYKEQYIACRFGKTMDFPVVARACGLAAYDLGTEKNPHASLRQALQKNGPCLIRIPITAEANVLPMVPPGKSNSEMIV